MRVLTLALLFTLALAAPAVAGGWAVTTLDPLPPDIGAGETYQIGWTIRQHGETPVNIESFGAGLTTAIIAIAPDKSQTLTFQGRREGPAGHYVASVSFPTEGSWTWSVTQGPFERQSLGTITVGSAGAATKASKDVATVAQTPALPRSTGPNGWLVAALLLASSAAAVFFGTRIAALTLRPRSA